jgi:septal ring factor EnvC (AmiA/AmiB activator)
MKKNIGALLIAITLLFSPMSQSKACGGLCIGAVAGGGVLVGAGLHSLYCKLFTCGDVVTQKEFDEVQAETDLKLQQAEEEAERIREELELARQARAELLEKIQEHEKRIARLEESDATQQFEIAELRLDVISWEKKVEILEGQIEGLKNSL